MYNLAISRLKPFGIVQFIYRVSLKKGTFTIFVLFPLKKSNLTFSHVFQNQNLSPFHLATQITSAQNPHCPKNAKNA